MGYNIVTIASRNVNGPTKKWQAKLLWLLEAKMSEVGHNSVMTENLEDGLQLAAETLPDAVIAFHCFEDFEAIHKRLRANAATAQTPILFVYPLPFIIEILPKVVRLPYNDSIFASSKSTEIINAVETLISKPPTSTLHPTE